LDKWLGLVEAEFPGKSKDTSKKAIAVHCVAGLGRAPVLVCIALVEAGMDPYDAIAHIRKRRRVLAFCLVPLIFCLLRLPLAAKPL
jgi:protein tyrosine phosphatase type 4A